LEMVQSIILLMFHSDGKIPLARLTENKWWIELMQNLGPDAIYILAALLWSCEFKAENVSSTVNKIEST